MHMATPPSGEVYWYVMHVFQNSVVRTKHRTLHIFFAFQRIAQNGDFEMETTSLLRHSSTIRSLTMELLAKGRLPVASNILRFC